jgi:PhnB protein
VSTENIAMNVPPIPPGYATLTPYLSVPDPAAAIAFYQAAFGATERMRLMMPDGSIGHAEIEIGDSVLMLSGAWPPVGFAPPEGGTVPVMLHLYVADADAVFARAVDAGALPLAPVETKFYGDRSGSLRDPFGHRWSVSTHVEDVSTEEAQRRIAAMPVEGG